MRRIKLKTLKDLEISDHQGLSYDDDVLKKAVREWIKSFNDFPKDRNEYYYDYCLSCGKWVQDCKHRDDEVYFDSSDTYAMEIILKCFFNLDDEK